MTAKHGSNIKKLVNLFIECLEFLTVKDLALSVPGVSMCCGFSDHERIAPSHISSHLVFEYVSTSIWSDHSRSGLTSPLVPFYFPVRKDQVPCCF